ncbi:hypothetical protein GF108_19745 [Phyllobacterium sp. SYP-B3895]|uniref:hypothetical protein n=1 Tax=Phyllobacterium sp. SYP-B3895 TaxID=2663240 RepID=UPI00129A0908|nr:hypothetical protein [Phyllobacterium sp. SYP-B3895]MRG57803.1 hypothetical protein [Phyllobacterium sp. SYP-B3895]
MGGRVIDWLDQFLSDNTGKVSLAISDIDTLLFDLGAGRRCQGAGPRSLPCRLQGASAVDLFSWLTRCDHVLADQDKRQLLENCHSDLNVRNQGA